MEKKDSVALAAAIKQKRLRYWKQRFLEVNGDGAGDAARGTGGPVHSSTQEIASRLQTYGLLITKLATAEADDVRTEAESRLNALERELATLFEARRLMTTDVGVPRISGAGED